jgi:hypothetical protein
MTISQPKSNEKEISLCVQAAIEKLDRVDADAKEKKTQIVQDLAKDLEKKIPTDRICNEIVHQLRGKVSERLIRGCLDEKYKDNRRVENARKQKKKHQSTDDLAAPLPLNHQPEKKKIVINTSGKEVAEPQPSIIEGTEDKEVIAQSNRTKECNNCKVKDSKIEELKGLIMKAKKTRTVRENNPADNHNDVCEENAELKEALSRKDAFIKADEISLHEIEYIIPKEKGPDLGEAIQKCRDSVYLIFDKSGAFERAIPDIFRGK